MACCRNTMCLITIATILGPFVEVFLVVSFATSHWIDTHVDRSVLTQTQRQMTAADEALGRIYFSRNRGIIRECYHDAEASFLDTDGDVVDGHCFHLDFELPSGSHSSHEKSRIHLNRSILAMFAVALVLVVVTFILGVVLCCHRSVHIGVAAGVTSILASILVLIGIILFHVLRYLETNKDGDPGEYAFENNWPQILKDTKDNEHCYSYSLAWVSFVLAAIDGVFYLFAAKAVQIEQFTEHYLNSSYNDRQQIHKKTTIRKSKGKQIADNVAPHDDQNKPVQAMTATPMFYPSYVSAMPDHNMMAIPNDGYAGSNADGVFFQPSAAIYAYQ